MKVLTIGNDYAYQLELKRREANKETKKGKEVTDVENQLQKGGPKVLESTEETAAEKDGADKSKRKRTAKISQEEAEKKEGE